MTISSENRFPAIVSLLLPSIKGWSKAETFTFVENHAQKVKNLIFAYIFVTTPFLKESWTFLILAYV